jgi:membrane-associated protease RseP (regulator of RpoE activity)
MPGSLGQLFVIVTIFVIVAISLGWDATIPWHPWSWFGFSTDASGRFTSVKPGYPAARAGIQAGDSIDLTTTPAAARRWLVGQYPGVTQSSGVSATFTVEHGSAARPVTLASQVRPRSFADNLSLLLSTFGSFVFLAVCTILLLLRPSGIT